MIAAAAVAMATCSYAASITWKWDVFTTSQSFNGYAAPATSLNKVWGDAAVTGGMAYYLINADVYSQNQLLTAIRNGDDWSSAILASGNTVNSKDANNGKISKNEFTTTTTYADDEPIPSVTLNAYVLMINDAEDYAYFSGSVSKAGDKSGGQVDLTPTITTSKVLRDLDGTTDFTGSNYGWYAVPEPTSGLLLLIGVAGLALKRKRA